MRMRCHPNHAPDTQEGYALIQDIVIDAASDYSDFMSEKTAFKPEGVLRPERVLAIRKSERTYDAIVTSAVEFLWTHPFRELTVAKLMSLAGASRPAFYQYFSDLHQLMEVLLDDIQAAIMESANPWLRGEVGHIHGLEMSLRGLIDVSYSNGPIIRAVADAAASDHRLEQAWQQFLQSFEMAIAARIEQDQAAGLTAAFPALPMAVALTRLDAATMIEFFGHRPRGNPEDVFQILRRIWISTLYGEPGLLQMKQ